MTFNLQTITAPKVRVVSITSFDKAHKNGKPIGSAFGLTGGVEALREMASAWCGSKKGRKARVVGLCMTHYYSDGKVAGFVEVDPLPARGVA